MTMDFLGGYKPTETDKVFARWVVSHIKDGGIWGLPINGAAFRVYHNPAGVGGGRLVLVDDFCDDELFSRTKAVFATIGYSVVGRGEARPADASPASL